jgi:hypothetical protein
MASDVENQPDCNTRPYFAVDDLQYAGPALSSRRILKDSHFLCRFWGKVFKLQHKRHLGIEDLLKSGWGGFVRK